MNVKSMIDLVKWMDILLVRWLSGFIGGTIFLAMILSIIAAGLLCLAVFPLFIAMLLRKEFSTAVESLGLGIFATYFCRAMRPVLTEYMESLKTRDSRQPGSRNQV